MPGAKTTVKVAVTNNAAKDDSYSGGSLDWLSESGSLSGKLDVLGNDPGSATLWGVSSTAPTGTGTISQEAAGSTDCFTVNYGDQAYSGKLTLNSDGTVGFDLSSLAGKLDGLAEGETISTTFYYTARMANGALSVAKVTVEITGENDAPVATAETVTILEDAAVLNGQLDATDADHGAVLTYALDDDAPAGFSLASDGSYTFDPSVEAYQHLGAGDTQEITVSYTVTDEHGAHSSASITITVTGVNDEASFGDGSVFEGAVTEGDEDAVTGSVVVEDVDDGEATTAEDSGTSAGGYGTYTVDDAGNWSFTLDQDAANSLQGGEEVTDTFEVSSADGTATETVTVTITGVNDAAEFGGDDSGEVTEDSVLVATGVLTIDDADHDESRFVAQEDTQGDYGTFSIDEDGNWTYELDGNLADGLDNGDVETDTFTVASADGTATSVTITINGHTDAVPTTLAPVQTYDPSNPDPNNKDSLGDPASTTNSSAATNGPDTIYLGAGNDTFNSGNGNDTVYAGSGTDTVGGGADLDKLYGGDGNDTLMGGNHNDLIVGGYGADTLTGNAGADMFQFLDPRDRGDTLVDFNRGEGDKIDVGDLGFTGGFGGSTATSHGLWQDGNHVYGDTDGVLSTIEFYFDIGAGALTQTLSASDFILV